MLIWSVLCTVVAAASTFEPVRPPALPLAVRNPYLNTVLPAGSDGGNGGYLAGEWPTFWNGVITGWSGMIRVDGVNYVWMGDPHEGSANVNQISYSYTSTRSLFTMDIHRKVRMQIEFLSPIYPNNMKLQSFPVAYMDVTVFSIDGSSHSVQIYSDITAEWISGDKSSIANWKYGVTDGVAYHHVYKQNQQLFSEVSDQTEYGNWYYATANVTGLTHQSGADTDVRSQFVKHGHLTNTQDTNYRAINDDYPVFAWAKDLGKIRKKVSTLFTINLAQEKVIRFEGKQGNVSLPGLWTSHFSNDLDAVKSLYHDFAKATTSASELDQEIAQASTAAAGKNYTALTTLATRQAFGALQLAGTPEKHYIFMKEISSDGNVNTVDVIFPFHPMALYLNPNLLRLLLDPLFENQEAGYWPFKYSIHDIGALFPNATGHNGDKASVKLSTEAQPLEECGNMIIMALAYAQRTNDNAYLKDHYPILKQWNAYLMKDSLYPRNQMYEARSTDDFAGSLANQTNLAIKGIIGIKAMAQIATRVGEKDDARKFSRTADRYLEKWQELGNNLEAEPPHSTLAYHKSNTHGLLYNIYADKELGLNFVPQKVFEQQSNFYPTVVRKYGVPLDTRHFYTKADWQIWCAAVASDSTRDLFTSRIAKWLNETPSNLPFSDLYQTGSGDFANDILFIARPTVGGMFAVLALQ